ncbi:hypothetical protein VTH82DRAFT_5324 [Thermothelomyces myriococcoides]
MNLGQLAEGTSVTATELSRSPVGPVPSTGIVGVHGQVPNLRPELGGDTRRPTTVAPPAPGTADLITGGVMPQQAQGLPATTKTKMNFNINSWNPHQMPGPYRRAMRAQPEGPHPGDPSLRRDLQLLGPAGRQLSYDSTEETIINNNLDDLSTYPTDYYGEGTLGIPQVHSLTSTAVSTPASSTPTISPAASRRRKGRRGKQPDDGQARDNSPLYCDACDYYASGGDPRRMMYKHIKSDRHRENTGQPPAERIPCPLCPSTHNRRDNVQSHIKKVHGEEALLQLSRSLDLHMQMPQQQQQQQRRSRGGGLGRVMHMVVPRPRRVG